MHCSVFALSDSTNPDLRQQCDHKHEEVCEQCENLNSTLAAISEAVARAPFHTRRGCISYQPRHACHPVMEMPFVTIRTPRSGSPGCHRCTQPRNDFLCKRLGNEVFAAEVPRLASRLVWQAWYILAHVSRVPTGRRSPAVARVYTRHPVM